MIVAIAKPENAEGFIPFPAKLHMTPKEIRAELSLLLDEEEQKGIEIKICTTDITTLNFINHNNSYDYDVLIWSGAALVPLLSLHNLDCLAQMKLGSLWEEGLLMYDFE